MPGDGLIGQQSQGVDILASPKILKRSDANVTRRNAREHTARQRPFLAHDSFTGGDSGERAGRGYPERGHRFADNVFTDHRAEGRFAIAAAREWRAPRALQLQIVPRAVRVDDFAEQERAAVAELWREATELVASVGLRDRLGTVGDGVPRERCNAGS